VWLGDCLAKKGNDWVWFLGRTLLDSAWIARAVAVSASPLPSPPPMKVFTPKFKLRRLDNYRLAAPAGFWEEFPSRPYSTGKSLVMADRLRAAARVAGLGGSEKLAVVLGDITDGANIGCYGRCRWPTVSTNAPSAFEFGEQVTDAIAGWVDSGFAVGPFPVELRPPGVKVNGIMCRVKPNGSARVILNLSAPKGASVNEGIDKNEFPAVMSSTAAWLGVLNQVGPGALIMKMDWSDAYKHVHVRGQDVHLQWFSWLGRDFAETSLVFGAVSSAGIYDRLAKVVLEVVTRIAAFPQQHVCQYLDDVCAAAPGGSSSLHRLETVYRAVAADIGVRLAPTTDPDKAFSPCTAGVVLGIAYDTVAWTWAIPPEKLVRILLEIRGLVDCDVAPQHLVWRVVGRLLHYAPLVPGGRFNIDRVLKANAYSEDRNAAVPLDPGTRRQFYFWFLILRVCDGVTTIPAPEFCPPWAVTFATDAAGGSLDGSGRGARGVGPGFWFVLPWGRRINGGKRAADGRKLGRKLSALELVGPLVCLVAAPQLCRYNAVRVWVDNSGSVAIWKKGYSNSCDICNTIVRAIATVAAALGCRFFIEKITRCSTPEAVLADLLSKGDMGEFWRQSRLVGGFPLSPARLPVALTAWVDNPLADDDLGSRLLRELGLTG